jgi:hypothetical protein
MNKNAIQKYAIWARNELITQVKQRAYLYGIDETGYENEYAITVNGRVLTLNEQTQRRGFISQIKEHGYQQAVEEVAYTWFNRFAALRYMEVNDFLPTHIRVFSDANGEFRPEILRDVLHLELKGLDKSKVAELLNANKTDELYRYLLLTQCNALNSALPEMFEKLGSYTEMLLPGNILKAESVIGRLVSDIPEEDWKNADQENTEVKSSVQIIGWLYQYYNTEPKQAVFDGLKKNVKITKEKIPAATQLFTPNWIVRYMVENSLGRLWIEGHPNDSLKSKWKYYLDEAEQTPEVAAKLEDIRAEYRNLNPEDIKVIDPCMGSGHILVYAFDLLMQIYRTVGYSDRDAAKSILENNLYGLDIDRRAYQLAYFSLMMKARQYNHRIFTEDVRPQVYHPMGWSDGEEYGSLIKIDDPGKKPEAAKELTLFDVDYNTAQRVWNFKRLLSQKYDVAITNPPYMGSSGMSGRLSEYVKTNYPNSKSDMFAAFIERCSAFTKANGYQAMITQHAWMFLSSYEKLRTKLHACDVINMAHLGAKAFAEIGGEVVQSTAFVMRGGHIGGFKGMYVRLVDIDDADGKECEFLSGNHRYTADSDNFAKIPGSPVAYWVSDSLILAFELGTQLNNLAQPRVGLQTSDNERFIMLWHEILYTKIGFNIRKHSDTLKHEYKWYPHNKGGEFRKWYGNNYHVVDYWKDGLLIKQDKRERLERGLIEKKNSQCWNEEFYFLESLTWSRISSSNFGVRYSPVGHVFDTAGTALFAESKLLMYLLGLLSTKITKNILLMLNPTLTFQTGDISKIPVIINENDRINTLVTANIALSRADWDAFETSWDFKRHPLIGGRSIAAAFEKWEKECNERFNTLKANEEELNSIFIDIYGLSKELTPEVADKDITVRKANLQRDIKNLISYAVGCMFGRYSLDEDGLILAGQKYEERFVYGRAPIAGTGITGGSSFSYATTDCYLRKTDGTIKVAAFPPDRDNVLPICDDEYFDDDIVGRFVTFVKTVYGEDTLEENLRFIAEALGGSGTPREVIRKYFLNDFYKDHLKTYQKRPIYWLFDSGKKNGFKALIYLHRYTPDLLAKLRTDYVHEQQERYRTQLGHISDTLNGASGSDRAKLLKQQEKLTAQAQEIAKFEEKVHHLADMNIEIDLDDGVKRNYEKFADVLGKI